MIKLNTTAGKHYTEIKSIGVYRPKRIVTNEEICKKIDSSDEWIFSRTGIKNRRFADETESIRNMSVHAGKIALKNSGVAKEKIGAVLLTTSTWPQQVPHGAPTVANDLGINGVAAMDLTAGCAAFGHSLAIADALIKSGTTNYVLIIAAERMSDGLDMTNRSNCFIFGDGAGAVVVGPSETPGISPVVWGSEGSKADAIRQTVSITDFMKDPSVPMSLVMEGATVFRWAAFEMGKVANEILTKAGVDISQIQAFIPHQANARINELLAKGLNLPENIPIANDIQETGNTSAASIPLAMEELIRTGKSKAGDLALLLSYGAGLTYAGQVVKLPANPIII